VKQVLTFILLAAALKDDGENSYYWLSSFETVHEVRSCVFRIARLTEWCK
jgi:hypothetical protein